MIRLFVHARIAARSLAFATNAAAVVATIVAAAPHVARAQARVPDGPARLRRLRHDLAYGTVEAIGFAALDQARNSPPEWGSGTSGYGKRALSNIGEFYIQETVTEGLAAVMHRPLDYRKCGCHDTGPRVWSAVRGAVTDGMPDGTHPLAVPRIVGAYTGAFVQTTWRPDDHTDRVRTALLNGTGSLALGVLINLYHEFR